MLVHAAAESPSRAHILLVVESSHPRLDQAQLHFSPLQGDALVRLLDTLRIEQLLVVLAYQDHSLGYVHGVSKNEAIVTSFVHDNASALRGVES